jgi:signal transduction histidine kinase
MLLQLLVFTLGLLSVFGRSAAAEPMPMGANVYVLGAAEVSYLSDSAPSLQFEMVSDPTLAAKFVSTPQLPALGYRNAEVWLRITIQRPVGGPDTWLLEVTNSFINDVRFYAPDPTGFTLTQGGDRFAFADRQIAFRHPVFELILPDAQPRTFYLRLLSDSSLSTQLMLWKPSAFWDMARRELLLYGAVLGMLAMSLLITLLHWYYSRDPKMLRFALLTVSILVLVPSQLGLTAQFFLQDWPKVADLLVPWTLAITIAVLTLMFQDYLSTRRISSSLNRLLQGAAFLSLMMPLTREFGWYSAVGGPALQFLLIGTLCLTGWMAWTQWRTHLTRARYVLAACLILFVVSLLSRLIVVGLLPEATPTFSSWIPGLLPLLILVHAGVALETMAGRRERQNLQLQAQIERKIAHGEAHLRGEQAVFFAFAAHELRTPLSVMVAGLNGLASDGTGASETRATRIARMERAAHRMGRLIEKHLRLQQLGSDGFVPRYRATEPCAPVDQALNELQVIFLKRTFVQTRTQPLPTTVQLDDELVVLALSNLLINAAKYSPHDSTVQIDVSADSALHFRVSDHGPGVALADRAQMFSIFRQVTAAGSTEGFGVGLAIVQRVATAHGGTLKYEDAPGGGAVFTMT